MLQVMPDRFDQFDAFRADVLAGLSQSQKTLPSRWLYDVRGSELFERITRLTEYYPTRTETAILSEHAQEIADFCGEKAIILEYGAGAGIKTEILIDALREPRLYVPIDIAGDFLDQTVARFRRRFPDLQTRPIVADFTAAFALPAWKHAARVLTLPRNTSPPKFSISGRWTRARSFSTTSASSRPSHAMTKKRKLAVAI